MYHPDVMVAVVVFHKRRGPFHHTKDLRVGRHTMHDFQLRVALLCLHQLPDFQRVPFVHKPVFLVVQRNGGPVFLTPTVVRRDDHVGAVHIRPLHHPHGSLFPGDLVGSINRVVVDLVFAHNHADAVGVTVAQGRPNEHQFAGGVRNKQPDVFHAFRKHIGPFHDRRLKMFLGLVITHGVKRIVVLRPVLQQRTNVFRADFLFVVRVPIRTVVVDPVIHVPGRQNTPAIVHHVTRRHRAVR